MFTLRLYRLLLLILLLIGSSLETNNAISRTIEVRSTDLTWYVDGNVATSGDGRSPAQAFKSIGEAIAQALDGDTIQVAAGNYDEDVVLPVGVRLLGNGYENTKIYGTNSTRAIVSLHAQTVISGFTIAGNHENQNRDAVSIQGDNIRVNNNHLTQSNYGIHIACGQTRPCTAPITITHNIIDDNQYSGIFVSTAQTTTIRNNTVVSNNVGIALAGNFTALIENNIVAMNQSVGMSALRGNTEPLSADRILARYNNVWRNGIAVGRTQDYSGVQAEPGSLAVDPLFRNLMAGDYRLPATSPMIGQGRPAGTDMGALPFMPIGTPPAEVKVMQVADGVWKVNWLPDASQGYRLHVGIKSGEYLFHYDARSNNEYQFESVPDGFTYYLVVNGYDVNGNDTKVSSEVQFHVPEVLGSRDNATDGNVSTPVINHEASQTVPAIDNKRVVWQDERFGPAEIFLADLTTGEITNITTSNEWEANPDIDGDIVVWRDGYKGIGVHGINLATGQAYTIAEGHSDVHMPKISGTIVVWAGKQPNENIWRIYGYDLNTGTRMLIAQAANLHPEVKIDAPLVVWADLAGRIYLYNWHTQKTQTILNDRLGSYPDVSVRDNLVVWQDMRNGNSDIYGYDLLADEIRPLVIAPHHQERPALDAGLLTYQSQIVDISWNVYALPLGGTPFQITDNSNPQIFPVTDGQNIVWQDSRNHQSDIYRFVWTGTIPQHSTHGLQAPSSLQAGSFPENKVFLQWTSHATKTIGYEIERAAGIVGTRWQKIATIPVNTQHFTDTPPILGETYWYRVRAVTIGETSTYSNDSFNSTFDQVPSPDELYLMTLVNEARAAPSRFGYPSYPPVPPLAYNPLVAYSARAHSQSILNSTYQFGHCDPIGRCPGERAQAVGFMGGCGENLHSVNTGYLEMQNANQGLLDSEGHRNNLLAPDFTVMGLGHTYDNRKGEPSRHGQITQVFCGPEIAPPVLLVGAVVPYHGNTSTDFTYAVNFYSAAGHSPTSAQVVIDGTPYAMTLSSGAPSHGTYRYTTRLSPHSTHEYFFCLPMGMGKQPAGLSMGQSRIRT